MNSKKFNIEFHSVVRDLLRNFWVIICSIIIGLMGSYIATNLFYSPEYTSSATLIINSAVGQQNGYASLAASSEIASIYTKVFVQPSMKEKVCEYLGIKNFDGSIRAYVNESTNIMELSVVAKEAESAYKELCAILNVYPKLTKNLFKNGAVGVLKMPTVPKMPSNAMNRTSAIKISVASIAISIILIVVVSVLRDTIKDTRNFEEKIDSKLLGFITHEKKRFKFSEIIQRKKKSILINESAFLSLRFSENFNKIAAKIENMKRTDGSKIFAVTSVSENEGKSTVASNIALSLAQKGNIVALVDLDCKKPALHKIFEEENDSMPDLCDFLSGDVSSKDFKLKRYKKTNLYLAMNFKSHKDYQKWYDDGSLEKVLGAIAKKADFVIVDTAPVSVDSTVTGIAKMSDKNILVIRTDTVYISVINDTLLTLKNTGADIAGCVLNDVHNEFSFFGQMGSDETEYNHYSRYDKYGKYTKYLKYGSYGKYGKYGKYSQYSRYGKYGKYNQYSRYGSYGKYGKYGRYGKYGKYDKYGKYGKYSNYGFDEENNQEDEVIDLTTVDIDERNGD